MKIFLAGGSGAIGRLLIPRLIAAGHEVVATTRDPRKGDELRLLGAEPAVVDALDERAVVDAVARAQPEVVVHELTALPRVTRLRRWDREFALTNRLRTRGTDHLIRAAQLVGARRLVAQSFAGWPNTRAGGLVKSEGDPLDPDPPAAMRESLEALRYLERAVVSASGLEGIVLRYGSLYGPGTAMSNEYAEMIRRQKLPVIGDGAGVWSFLHVDDAATATVAALERGAAGICNIVDDEPAPVSEWLPRVAELLGARPPRRIPVWLGRLATGEVGVSMMTRIRGASNAKAKRELGWEPRHKSWRDGFGVEGDELEANVPLMLGLPGRVEVCLFDMDGVLTQTARVHAAAWKEMFDAFLAERATDSSEAFVPFDHDADYDRFVDGKPRYEGVSSFLASRGIELPRGDPDDPPGAETVDGLGNRKNEIVQRMIREDGVEAYPGSVRYVDAARSAGLRTAVVSSRTNTREVLEAARIEGLFDARIDGVVAEQRGLRGKPAPDTFLAGAEALGVEPAAAAVYEDALAGVEAGRAGHFGIVIGVDRVGQADALAEHGADLVVGDLAELLDDA